MCEHMGYMTVVTVSRYTYLMTGSLSGNCVDLWGDSVHWLPPYRSLREDECVVYGSD